MKNILLRILTIVSLLFVSFTLYSNTVFAGKGEKSQLDLQEQGAQEFIKRMTESGLKFISNPNLSKAQKRKSFKKLLYSNFDLNYIGKFAVGTHWRKMPQSQKNEYMTLFKAMLVNVYSKRFDEYQGQQIVISKTINLSEKDSLVKSKIISPDSGTDVPVNWRVRLKDGKYKIIDVMVAGISMSITQRSDFSSVIQRGGGKIDTLIDHLKN